MIIELSPQRREQPLSLSRSGDILTINNAAYDFSPIPEGGLLPREAVECEWLASDVERIDGEIRLTLILPHGPNAPEETRFPQPIHVAEDGPVELPPYDAEPEEPVEGSSKEEEGSPRDGN